ncbi:MAG: hypothetical protein HRT35_33835, partial [Algicola sp.]|nr:hypothetical protein [Algicola sp.]
MAVEPPNYSSTNDAPTLNDISLGTQPFIAQLATNIHGAHPPKTYAITGYWGAGKTSALAMLYKELTGAAPPGFDQSDN